MPINVCMVATAAVTHETTLAAWWDGGPEIRVHRHAGGAVHVVARWRVWNDVWDCPLIEPSRESFERYVRARLEEPGCLDELFAVEV